MNEGYVIADRYICKEKLGKGANGSVYLVYDNKLDKYWAVKECIMHNENEIEALKSVDNNAFVRIVDVIRQDMCEFVIMDRVEGITLSEYCRSHAPNEKTIIRWMTEVAKAMNYLHNLKTPLLYMDCKPDNIMLTNSGDIRLVDLGSTYTYTVRNNNIRISSTRFFAPKEIKDNNEGIHLDIYSDVYSFGMTMYRLLTLSNIEYRDRRGRLCPEYINKHISRACSDIVKRSTMTDPNKRYHSMNDVIRDLSEALNTKKRHRFNVPLMFDHIVKYALSIIIILCAMYTNIQFNTFAIPGLFILLVCLCKRPSYYTWETKKSIVRTY